MKREKEKEYPKVKIIHPRLFWKECVFCRKEFRKETGYEIVDFKQCRASGEYPYFTSYCCNECANSADEVKERVEKRKTSFYHSKPPMPGSGMK